SLRVLDGGVVVLDAVAGVEPQSETVWRQADHYGVPRIVFVNKMDRAGASFARCLSMLNERLGAPAVAIQLPLGEQQEFQGMIDLIRMRALTYGDATSMVITEELIPPTLAEEAREWRRQLVERVAESD